MRTHIGSGRRATETDGWTSSLTWSRRFFRQRVSQGPHPFAGIASFWDLDAIQKTAGRAAFPVHTIMASPSGWEDVAVRGIESRPVPAVTFDLPDGLTDDDMPPR
jgi:hypothetical protein